MKVFWTDVAVTAVEDGHGVALDGRPIRTPAKALLTVPTQALAEALAAEWRAQDDRIHPDQMPLTRAANTAIDRVSRAVEAVTAEIADFGDSDLICYRARHPAALAAREAELWDPLVDWSASTLGARLDVMEGLMHRSQPAETQAVFRDAVARHSMWELTALHDLVTLSGSLVIGLAISHGHLTAAEAWPLSRIDEDWNIAEWGEDAEAADVARRKHAAFTDADRLLTLLRS
ncbi:MAG: ATP12 family protein [Pseudomonadota bacterium]